MPASSEVINAPSCHGNGFFFQSRLLRTYLSGLGQWTWIQILSLLLQQSRVPCQVPLPLSLHQIITTWGYDNGTFV